MVIESSQEVSNVLLESSLNFEGQPNKDILRQFFEAFLKGPLYVPNRAQNSQLSHQPEYPNEFVSVMGVQDSERVIIPVFSSPSFISEWASQNFEYRKFSGEQLLDILPQGWWLSVNPGQDVGKDISPWEIEMLKAGDRSFDELIQEIIDGESEDNALEISPLLPEEHNSFKQALIEYVKDITYVSELFLGSVKKEQSYEVIVGLAIDSVHTDQIESLRDKIRKFCEPYFIGNTPIKIIVDHNESNLLLGTFADILPVYSQSTSTKSSLLSKTIGLFRPFKKKS